MIELPAPVAILFALACLLYASALVARIVQTVRAPRSEQREP